MGDKKCDDPHNVEAFTITKMNGEKWEGGSAIICLVDDCIDPENKNLGFDGEYWELVCY